MLQDLTFPRKLLQLKHKLIYFTFPLIFSSQEGRVGGYHLADPNQMVTAAKLTVEMATLGLLLCCHLLPTDL